MTNKVDKAAFDTVFTKLWSRPGSDNHSVGCRLLDILIRRNLQMEVDDIPDTCELDEIRQDLIESADDMETCYHQFDMWNSELQEQIKNGDMTLLF